MMMYDLHSWGAASIVGGISLSVFCMQSRPIQIQASTVASCLYVPLSAIAYVKPKTVPCTSVHLIHRARLRALFLIY